MYLQWGSSPLYTSVLILRYLFIMFPGFLYTETKYMSTLKENNGQDKRKYIQVKFQCHKTPPGNKLAPLFNYSLATIDCLWDIPNLEGLGEWFVSTEQLITHTSSPYLNPNYKHLSFAAWNNKRLKSTGF